MSQSDRERWNARWRERDRVASRPSPWVVSLDSMLPRRGRALDLAGGGGRHALWLAGRGLDVTLADISDEGLALAGAAAAELEVTLRLVEIDLERDPLPSGPWDLILCFHYLERSLFPAIAAELAPGGFLVFCHQTEKNLERHPRPRPPHLLAEGEAATSIAGLDLVLVSCEEGWHDEGRHEARLVARRLRG